MLVRELVDSIRETIDARWEGDGDRDLKRVAPIEEATGSELAFVSHGRSLKDSAESRAGCLIVPEAFENSPGRTVIRTSDPRAAAAVAIAILHPDPKPAPGIHPTAVIGPFTEVDETASIGPLVTIGERVKIGAHSTVGAGSVIGDDVSIGEGTVLHARVTIYRNVSVGKAVVLHSGCVIGADGFGFVMVGGKYEKFPQVGRVEIGDRVEIGANSCVDRAALGVTRIGEGTKLDNMVHVAHNCQIGRHVVIAAQTGFSGGVEVGDYAVIGGQVGVGPKARIEAKAVLGSGSGVLTSKIVRAGEVMWGTPARPLKQYLLQLAALAKLGKKIDR